MLTGMQLAWFEQYKTARTDMERAREGRRGGSHGIAVHDDNKALRFQIAEYRAVRAEHALKGNWWPEAMKNFRTTALKARAELRRRAETGERLGIND